ncbi:MAG: hypothetical protein JNJ59_24195 [Deltaproteobacteria bacterium]|nr:hypothetical protein [Deltaproteobacteria bacterium]
MDSEGFKAVVAGDEVTRRHVHGRPFTFRPRAAHLIAANRLPPVGDGSHGFWRRVVVVGFGRRFDGSPDLGLATRIVADELGGVLAWALTGAARALVAGRYTLPASSSVAVDEWRVGSDAVAQWLDARTDPVTETWRGTAASAAYADFRRWAADNGHRLVSQHTFGARLKPLISCAKSHGVMTYALILR